MSRLFRHVISLFHQLSNPLEYPLAVQIQHLKDTCNRPKTISSISYGSSGGAFFEEGGGETSHNSIEHENARGATPVYATEEGPSLQVSPAEDGGYGQSGVPPVTQDLQNLRPSTERQVDPSELFRGAHHFVVNNPVMTAIDADAKATAMELLSRTGMANAGLNSSARYPPPHCHPGTRQSLRDRITAWVTNDHRESHLLWLYGPAGVGKSAVAQTVAEHCQSQSWLGAAFFFSRPNNCDDPDGVVASLAYQLSLEHMAYRQAVAQLVTQDPAIFESALHVQFQKLIVELLSRPDVGRSFIHPTLIVLDGLDECRGDNAQKQFISLIASFSATCRRTSLPFVWLIVSRPEWQIVSGFSKVDDLLREELRVDDFESQLDVSSFLRAGFEQILEEYGDAFRPNAIWPSEDEFLVIRSAASGLFVFASTVLKFVGDSEVGNPVAQLKLCLGFLKGNLTPEGENPLDQLYALYRGIMNTIHPKILPTTIRILDLVAGEANIPAQCIANFLFIDQATLYGSLRRLHSVVSVPPAGDARHAWLRVYHASFSDFIKHICKSGESGVTLHDVNSEMRKRCIRWFNLQKLNLAVPDRGSVDFLTWPAGMSDSLIHLIFEYAEEKLVEVWSHVSESGMQELYNDVRHIDFREVAQNKFRECVLMLLKLSIWQQYSGSQSDVPILRFEPRTAVDRSLFQEYACFTSHGAMRRGNYGHLADKNFWVINTPAAETQRFLGLLRGVDNPTYFFVGHGETTCLVIAL